MLDKTIPYKAILMQRPAGAPLPPVALPPDYHFQFFRAGDEKDWAQIEASVLEFPSEFDALLWFQKNWLPFLPELERRCTFIVHAETGEKVATATAWWDYSGGRRDPWVDWVSVRPGHQQKGLGRAVVANVLDLMMGMEGDRNFYLKTQTWSHRAVRIYQWAGFVFTDEPGLRGHPNDEYREALAILEQVDQRSRG